MVKVQHGWERRNISELEDMNSGRSSPYQTASTVFRDQGRRINNDYPGSRPVSAHSTNTSVGWDPALSDSTARLSHQTTASRSLPSSAKDPPTYTYEAFWQSHSAQGQQPSANHSMSQPSLAPPVDIRPRGARPTSSPHDTHFSPTPPYPSPGAVSDIHHEANPLTPHPATSTPKRAPLAKMRTPSQQAAVEKDAVETLLFMSSPGNSQHYSPHKLDEPRASNPSLLSPNRSRHARNSSNHTSPSTFTTEPQQQYHKFSDKAADLRRKKKQPLTDHDLDQLIDEMSESDDSSGGSNASLNFRDRRH